MPLLPWMDLSVGYHVTPFARVSSTIGSSIVEITTASPFGMRKSNLTQHNSNEWFVDVTWSPSNFQNGPNIFCYSAMGNAGYIVIILVLKYMYNSFRVSSFQRCITLMVGGIDFQ